MADTGTVEVGYVYRHSRAYIRDDTKEVFMRLPERIAFEERNDTIIHIVESIEYLWELSQAYYGGLLPNAFDLWEVIRDFQPRPIQDPSLPLPLNMEIYIPSTDFIDEVVFGTSLSETSEI